MKSKIINPRNLVFYGWFALAGAMLAAFVDTGAFGYSYGIFLPTICNEFGWSRATVSLGLSLGLLCFGLPSPITGYLVARFGPRIHIILGNLLATAGLAGIFFANQIWHIYLAYSLAGMGAGMGGYIAATTTVNNWFIKKRSLATGMFFAATSASGFVFPPLITFLISTMGWRMSWLVLSGIVFTGASLIGGLILVRNRPEDIGQVPDGEPAKFDSDVSDIGTIRETIIEPEGWTAKQALKQPATWLIAAMTATNLFAFNVMLGHQVAYLTDIGYSPVTAALSLSLLSGMGVLGSLGFGIIGLRFNIKNLASVFFLIRLMALGLLLTTQNMGPLFVYSALFGVSHGALLTAMPTMLGAYYGRKHYAQILGMIFMVQVAAGAAGPTVAGAIYDSTTTYMPAFILITIVTAIGLVSVFLARQPKQYA